MKKSTLLVVFIIVALLATAAFAKIDKGRLGIMLPSKQGENSEVLPIDKYELAALRAGEITVNDIYLAKTTGVVDTFRTPIEYTVRFGASPGDTMVSHFKPPASLIVKAIGMNMSDIDDGGPECHVVNLSLTKSAWDPENWPVDSLDADGWLGSFYEPNVFTTSTNGYYPIQWEAGHMPLWGEFPVTITETAVFTWTEMIFMGSEPDVGRDAFLAVMVPVGAADGTMRWQSGDATTLPNWWGLKSYQHEVGAGTSGNGGWHVRHYGWMVYAVVEYYENTAPVVTTTGTYGTVLANDARTVSCHVFDIDANNPAEAGVNSVTMQYDVNSSGTWTDVAATMVSGTDTDGDWEADIPAGTLTPGDVVTFKFITADKAGLPAESQETSYGYFAKTTELLVFYNDDGTSYPSWILSPYYDNLWVNDSDVPYEYDVWVGTADGALSAELITPYNNIVQIDAYSPQTMNDDVLGPWFAAGPKNMFWSSQEYAGQFCGGWGAENDTTFAADDWHNAYLGLGYIGGAGHDIMTDPFPINPVEGDPISGEMFTFLGDSLQLYVNCDFELGFTNWGDAITAGDGAVVCFTDSAEGRTVGVHKENGSYKGVFLGFDQLCLDTGALPSYTVTDGYHWTEPNNASIAGAALRWFGVPTDVDTELPTVAAEYRLNQNYPNPFNPETRITYSISQPGKVKLAVYNVLGQKVADLVNEHKTANTYKVTFDASNLTSGVYFYRLEVGDYSKTMKMMLLR